MSYGQHPQKTSAKVKSRNHLLLKFGGSSRGDNAHTYALADVSTQYVTKYTAAAIFSRPYLVQSRYWYAVASVVVVVCLSSVCNVMYCD